MAQLQPSPHPTLTSSLYVFGGDLGMRESVLQGCVKRLWASFVSDLSQTAALLWSYSQEAKRPHFCSELWSS